MVVVLPIRIMMIAVSMGIVGECARGPDNVKYLFTAAYDSQAP